MEELEQGNIPEQQQKDEQYIAYEEFFNGERLFRVLNFFYGRRLVKDYTFRTPSPNQYAREKSILLVGSIVLLLCWWVLSIGLKVAILILCALGVMMYKRLAGDCVFRLISGL